MALRKQRACCQDARQKSELKKLEDELQMLRPIKQEAKHKFHVCRCRAFFVLSLSS